MPSAPSARCCNCSSCPTAPSRCWSRAARARASCRSPTIPNFFQAHAETIEEKAGDTRELEALARSVISQFEQYVKLNKKIPPEVIVSLNQIEEPGKLADTVTSHLALKIGEKQEILEIAGVAERLERVCRTWNPRSACCRSRSASATA